MIKKIRSPNYLIILGETYTLLGQVTGERDHVEEALRYLDKAAFFFGNTPSLPAFEAVAHHLASKLAMDDQQWKKADEHWRLAEESLRELEQKQFEHYTFGVAIQAWNYGDRAFHRGVLADQLVPDSEIDIYRKKSKQAWQELVKEKRGPVWPIYLAAHSLTFEPDLTKSREEFEKYFYNESNPYSKVALGWMYVGSRGLDPEQKKSIEDLVFDPSKSIQVRGLAFDLMCVSLSAGEIRELAKSFMEEKNESLLSGWGGDLSFKYLRGDYGDGEQADEEFLRRSQEKKDYSLCVAYFKIGLLKLAEGNPDEAKEFFQRTFETNSTGMFEYALAMALYRLLSEPDSQWPNLTHPDGEQAK